MRIDTTFNDEFDNWYNTFGQNEKGRVLLDIEGISRRCLDVGGMSHAYFTEKFADVTIDSNANAGEDISPNNYGAEIVKGIQKVEGYYLLYRYAIRRFGEARANEMLSSIVKGDVYFHDASGVGIQEVYCTSVSTTPIMLEGRPYGPLYSIPPKRADSFMAQCIEYLMDLSQQFAGAVALGDLIVNYAWYARREGLDDKAIVNDFQKFVHVTNNTFRVAGQSPFSNISVFDMPNLRKLFEYHRYPDGSEVDYDYVMHIQKIFSEWFSKGDPVSKLPYRFPIVTMNICCDENKDVMDPEFLDFVAKVNLENGCFNIYINEGNKIASCCRLVNNLERMTFRADTFGNGGMNIGSTRVVTLNLPRLAIKAKGDREKLFRGLDEALVLARDLLITHREDIIERRINAEFLKFFSPLKWLDVRRYFSTFGIIGIYEMNKLMGMDVRSEEGEAFTLEVLRYIEDFAIRTSKDTGYSFNVEEIPGESVAGKLCQKDKVIFGEEHVPFKLYSNQYIPVIENVPLPERITTTGKFMEVLSGGGILHLNMQDRITDQAVMRKLILFAVNNGVGHMAVNYGFGTCENGHTTICGNATKCPVCGSKIVDHVTRVIGYFSHVSNWGGVRREYEFPRRVFG